jgi:glycosyltransferase involved in cell wall biosynthesis
MERALCTKANYLANETEHQVFIITVKSLPEDLFFEYSSSLVIISLGLDIVRKYSIKNIIRRIRNQQTFIKAVSDKLNQLKPDITISMFGDEFPFLYKLDDGSIKIAEFHYSRNYLVHLIKNIPNLRFRGIRLLYATFFQYRQRILAQKYCKVILLTERDKHLWGNKKNLEVIPNAVSFRTDRVADLTNKQIIAVGRFIAQKGFDLLIKAFSLIAFQYPEWQVIIVGEGQDEGYLKDQIRQEQLESKVYLLPPQKDIKGLLLKSSIFALPSRYEGFGLVLTEAMECGIPCVAFDCECGPSEILTHGEDGYVSENGNVEQFAHHLASLMNDKDLRIKMGNAGRKNVRRFYVEPVMNKWLGLFSGLKSESHI